MGNMSYCRFENTARDLRDCLNAIEGSVTEGMSSYEIEGLKNILRMSKEIAVMEEHIEDLIERAKDEA